MDIPGLLCGRSTLCKLPLMVLFGAMLLLHGGNTSNSKNTCPRVTNISRFVNTLTCTILVKDVYHCTNSSKTTEATTSYPTTDSSAIRFTSIDSHTLEVATFTKRINKLEEKATWLMQKLLIENDTKRAEHIFNSLVTSLVTLGTDVLSSSSKLVDPGFQQKAVSMIFSAFERIGPKIASLTPNGSVQRRRSTDDLEIVLLKYNLTEVADKGIVVGVVSDTMSIDAETLEKATKGLDSLAMAVIVFKHPSKFISAEDIGNELIEQGNTEQASSYYLNTNLMMVSPDKDLVSDKQGTAADIGLTFSLNSPNPKGKATCIYLEVEDKNIAFGNCFLVKANSSHMECLCHHFTSFAILISITEEAENSDEVANILTYIFIPLGLFFLLLAFLTFVTFRNLRSDRNTIHTHLSVSLGFGQLLFLIGAGQTSHKIACAVFAGFLHYLFLVVFFWMLVEGLHIYFKLVLIFETSWSLIPLFVVLSYGLPLVIVTVSALIFPGGYGTDNACWLSKERGFEWSFVGPAVAIIVINLVMLGIAMQVMIRHYRSPTKNDMPTLDKMKSWIKGALALVFLMGITWLFGLLNTGHPATRFFAYIFIILNCSQGVFIFGFHCIGNNKVRKEYRRILRRAEWLPDCIRVPCFNLVAKASGADIKQTTTSTGYSTKKTDTGMKGTDEVAAAASSGMNKRTSNFRSSLVNAEPATPTQLADAGIYLGDADVYGADDIFHPFVPRPPQCINLPAYEEVNPGAFDYHGPSVDTSGMLAKQADTEATRGDENTGGEKNAEGADVAANDAAANNAAAPAAAADDTAALYGSDVKKDTLNTDVLEGNQMIDSSSVVDLPNAKNVSTIFSMLLPANDGTEPDNDS